MVTSQDSWNKIKEKNPFLKLLNQVDTGSTSPRNHLSHIVAKQAESIEKRRKSKPKDALNFCKIRRKTKRLP
jgi:hypothetical protein